MNYSKSFEPITALSKDENDILKLKYDCKPLGQLTDSELIQTTKKLILKIYTITGWAVPEEELKRILIDQLYKKIKESYGNVNESEIEYAFRNNLTVKDWGKSMNLVLIDEVLSGYLEKRSDVSMAEERYRLRLKELPVPDEKMSNDEFIELNKNIYLKTKNFALVSERCYTILINEDKMKRPVGEERERILKTARAWYFKDEHSSNEKLLISHAEQERMITIFSKKIAVCEYFNL